DFVQTNNSPTTTGVPAANFPATGIIPTIPLSPANVAILNAGGLPDYSRVTFIPGRDDPDSRRTSSFYTTAFVIRQAIHPRAGWQASYQRVHTDRVFANGPAGGGFQPPASNYSNYRGDIDTADAHASLALAAWLNLTAGYEFERELYNETQL